MRKFLKLYRKYALFLIAILIVVTPIVFFLRQSNISEAAWYDEAYLYRKKLTIGNSGSADANKKVKFDIDTEALINAGQMQADCDDIRFTSLGGEILRFHLDSTGGACDTSSTDFYVLMPTIVAGNNILYYYYGNTTALTASEGVQFGEATFSPTSGPTAGSEEKGPAPIAYWKFDEGTGTTLNDSSSYNNSGTISGATWQPVESCISGTCLFFDGSNDVVSFNDTNNSLDLTNALTMDAWVYPTRKTTSQLIISRWTADPYGYKLTAGDSDCGVGKFGMSLGNPRTDVCDTEVFNTNQWYHVVGTYDGTTGKLYVNGKLKKSLTIATAPIAGTSPVSIGDRVNDSFAPFKGRIDEPKMFNYAISSAQIKAEYASKSQTSSTGNAISTGTMSSLNLSNGLVGYWKMDEALWNGTANEILDSSGSSNNGTASGGATTGSGKFGKAGAFDGNNDYVNITDTSVFQITSSITVSTWVKYNTVSLYAGILSKMGNPGNRGYELLTDSTGKPIFYIASDSSNLVSIAASAEYDDNSWHNIVGIYEASNRKISIYVDGVISNSTTTNVPASQYSANNQDITLGTRSVYKATASESKFNGSIDEARIYNRALSPAEISQLYNFAPDPVAYWKFDEGTGATLSDSSGYSNGGDWNGTGSRWAVGKFGRSGMFNGTDDYISSDSSTSINSATGASQPRTISFWVYFNDNQVDVLAEKGSANHFYISTDSNGKVQWSCKTGSTNDVGEDTAHALNQWIHYTGVFYGTTLNLYKNGVLQTEANTIGETCPASDANDISLGGRVAGSNWFNGKIDEFKIYNYARTPKQIVEDMNSGHPAVGSPIASPIGYWKMDEGYGDTIYNYGNIGSGINGNLAGSGTSCPQTSSACPTWTNSAKFGKALTFDGSNDYIEVPNDLSLQFVHNFTISLWVKTANTSQSQKYLVSKRDNNYAIIYEYVDNTVEFYATGYSGEDPRPGSQITLDDTNWHYLAYTYDGNTLSGYKDGKVVFSNPRALAFASQTNSLILGAANSGANFFAGTLDEVKIYNYPLTPDEIKLDYNQNSAQILGNLSDNTSFEKQSASQVYCVPGDTNSCAAPVAEWKFDEGTGTAVNDTSGNGNLGDWDGTGNQWAKGKIGNAGSFDNTDDVVGLGNLSLLEGGDDATIEMWIYPKSYGTDNQCNGGQCDFLLFNHDYSYYFSILNSGVLETSWGTLPSNTWGAVSHTNSTGTVPLNSWTHIVVTKDNTDVKYYINGALDSTRTEDSSPIGSGTTDFNIGHNPGGTGWFDGNIDNIVIYDYARTQAQIAYDYNRGAPVAWYNFDECQGTTVYDYAPNANGGFKGNNGTISIGGSGDYSSTGTCSSGTSTESWNNGTTGKRNNSLALDGTDDNLTVNSNFSLGTINSSIALWVYLADNSESGAFVKIGGENSDGFAMGVGGSTYNNEGNDLIFLFEGVRWIDTNKVIGTGWHHIVLTINNSGTPSAYIDGNSIGEYSGAGAITPAASTKIGGHSLGGEDRYGKYLLDDLRIYNYALSETQIKQIMNNGAVFFGPTEGTP